MTMLPGISIVIPIYNEAGNIESLLHEITTVLSPPTQYEIVVVDDGSQDGSYEKLLAMQKTLSPLTIVRHASNFGQSTAIATGVAQARFKWIATLDGDGQNDPADILKLFSLAYEKHSDNTPTAVAGYRHKRNDSWLRKCSSRIANRIRSYLLQDNCPDTGCGLKVFPRSLFLRLPHFNHMHRFLPVLFKREGAEVINVPVHHRPRVHGVSKYGVMNRLWVGIVDLLGVRWLTRRPCPMESKIHVDN